MPKLRIIVSFCLAFLCIGSQAADSINCDAAPSNAVTKLPAEVSNLALVFCSPSGHALVAVDGYVWLAPNQRPYFLHSASPRGPIPGQTQHSVYFTNAGSRVLRGDAREKSKAMFKIEFGRAPPEDVAVTQLDLLSSKGFRYNVFFYVVAERLDRVIGCIDECNTSVGMTQVPLSSMK